MLESCRNSDHEACISTVYIDRKDCDCKCHKLSSINVEHKPTSREARVTSRQRSWYRSWWLVAFPPPAREYYADELPQDSKLIADEPTQEELWRKLQNRE